MFLAMLGVGSARAADVSLSATGGDGRIDLSWTVNGNLRGAQVMRDTDANPSGRQRLAILPGKVRNYTDNSVTNGRQYWYWIKYTDTSGSTGNSNAANTKAGDNGGTQPIAVTGVTVTPANTALSVGSTASLTARIQPSNASNKNVNWRSSNTGVATVNSNGMVTGVSAGNANITATTADGGRTASSAIKVLAGPAPTPAPTPVPGGTGLKDLAPFPVGVAVNAGNENNSIVSSGTSARQQAVVFPNFDQMTAGNIMKMSYLHPSENSFTYNQADELVSLARSHGLNIHAHTLIWHADYQVPGFMKNYSGDFAAMLKNHVQSIVTHFKGKVVSWDVVNEALADDGEGTVGNGLRSTVFSQKMGLNFIDQAFINARAADANVDLFYNDYNTEANGQKTRNLVALVDGMRSRGVPFTGVGFQMHVSIDWPSIGAIEASMKAIADRGLKVKISELDVGMRNAYSSLTAEAAARQKQRYHDIVAAYMRVVPPAQRAGITVWGVWDTDSWINQPGKPDWPLLFDANFQPKPAMQGFKDALAGK